MGIDHYTLTVASLHQRRDGRAEIRETVTTERGPRSRTLAIFRGALGPEVFERAEARATRPVDRDALIERAERLGIRTTARREDREVRAFLRALRHDVPMSPALVRAAKDALARIDVPAVPAWIAEVAEWIGAGEAERGEALRGLVRVYGRIAQSRPPRRQRSARRFPRFRSRPAVPST